MSHRSRGAVTATLLLTSAALGGCGAQAWSDLGPKPYAGQRIEVAATWTGTEQANFQAVLDAFAAKTGAKVGLTSGGDDLAVLINSRLAGGAPPDVALIPWPGVVAEYAAKGVLSKLSGEAVASVRQHYSPAWQQLGTVNGSLYGVYFKVANKSVIWYNTEAFDVAGVQPPKTMDELVNTSKVIADSGTTPMAVPGADGWPLTDWFENIYLRTAGPAKYDLLAEHKLSWTDPSVVQALKLLGAYWSTPDTVEGGPGGALQLSFTQSVADVFGDRPKAAMLFEGDFVATEITKLGKVEVGDGAKFFDWPAINGSKPSVVTAGDQAVAFNDRPVTMALIAYLASPEAAALMAGKGGFLSANSDLDPANYPDATTRRLAQSLVNAEVLRFDLSDMAPQSFGGQSGADMWRILQEFLGNPGADPAAIARKLEAAAVKDYGSRR